MEDKIYYGRGCLEQHDDYMKFINYVFAPDDSTFFENLLPKLYSPEQNPAYNSFIAVEDGEFRAAVGAFPCEMMVCGKKLKGVGIGNVACHPEHRSKGFMSKLMNLAVDDMVANGVDFSSLGGQRQRYGYFSYDTAGIVYKFYVTPGNIRHTYGNNFDDVANITFAKLKEDNIVALDKIDSIITSKQYYPVREKDLLYKTLCTWHCEPFIIKRDDDIIGYYVSGGDITEILLENDDDFVDVLRALVKNLGEINFRIPPFFTKYVDVLAAISTGLTVDGCAMFTVLCFKRVVDAFLSLKATYTKLVDGKVTFLIHGRGGDEKFTVSVCNNVVSVEDACCEADIELEHKDAMSLFFGNISTARTIAPSLCNAWFPVPLWQYQVDKV